MPASPTAERLLIDQLLNALWDLPEVQAELDRGEPAGSTGDRVHDARIDPRVAGKSFTLLIETRKAAYPRDVREAVWQLRAPSRRTHHPPGHDPVWLLVAEFISPGAKALLRDERVGYYDSGGSLYLPAPGAYLYIERPPSKSQVKSVRSLFSGRRAQVHALLVHHGDWVGVKDLAERALVSPATASLVLTELERYDWLASRGQGPSKERHLSEPSALLDACG